MALVIHILRTQQVAVLNQLLDSGLLERFIALVYDPDGTSNES